MRRLIVNNTFRNWAITRSAHDDDDDEDGRKGTLQPAQEEEEHRTALSDIKLILISGNKL